MARNEQVRGKRVEKKLGKALLGEETALSEKISEEREREKKTY